MCLFLSESSAVAKRSELRERESFDGHRTAYPLAHAMFRNPLKSNFFLQATFAITYSWKPLTNQNVIEFMGVSVVFL